MDQVWFEHLILGKQLIAFDSSPWNKDDMAVDISEFVSFLHPLMLLVDDLIDHINIGSDDKNYRVLVDRKHLLACQDEVLLDSDVVHHVTEQVGDRFEERSLENKGLGGVDLFQGLNSYLLQL
jgi:hypothetical protein